MCSLVWINCEPMQINKKSVLLLNTEQPHLGIKTARAFRCVMAPLHPDILREATAFLWRKAKPNLPPLPREI